MKTAFASSVAFTPAAAAYSAGDVISTAKELVNIGPAKASWIYVTSAWLRIDHTAVISGETSYRLHLYSVTPPSAHADNDAWDLPSGDRSAYRGYIDLGTPVDVGSTLYVQTDGINKQIEMTSTGSLFAELVTIGGFTATAAARNVKLFTVAL